MYRNILLALVLCPVIGFSQALFYNDGAAITVESGATVHVEGGIENTNSGTIDNDGLIQLEGDWTNDVASGLSSTSNSGTVRFLGTASQNITGTQNTTFHNLNIDNSTGVVLQRNSSAGGSNGGGQLILTSGYLDLNSNQITITNNSTSGISHTAGAYILSETDPTATYGVVNWQISTGTGSYIIPFGSSTDDLVFTYNVTSAGSESGTGTLSVNTYPADDANNNEYPTGVSNMESPSGSDVSLEVVDRFWVISLSNYTTDPSANLTLGYLDAEHGGSNTISESDLRAYEWDGSGPYWMVNSTGTLSTANNNITGISGSSNSTSIWSFIDNTALLSIALIDFDVAPVNNEYITTMWDVEHEDDVNFYTLQRSLDGVSFSDITEVPATGRLTYAVDDLDVSYNETYYYRLKWNHYDGTQGYSDVRTARLTASDVWSIGDFYPNPTMAGTHIDIHAPVEANLNILVFNQLGQQVANFTGKDLTKGPNRLSFDLSGLAHGSYLFRFQSDQWQAVKPVVKLR